MSSKRRIQCDVMRCYILNETNGISTDTDGTRREMRKYFFLFTHFYFYFFFIYSLSNLIVDEISDL